MRLLILVASVSLALAQHCPDRCECVTSDERELFCQVGGAKITYNGRNNEYVNIKCEGSNFTCADLPDINFANDMPLGSLWIQYCPPSILQCLPATLHMPSVSGYLGVLDGEAPLMGEHVVGLRDVNNLVIRRGPEKSIPISVVHNLPALKDLRITSTKITLESNAFTNATQLKILELSEGVIKEIPEDAFNGLSGLETLNIWGNSISEIGVHSFRGLSSLKNLYLDSSQISSIAPGSLAHVPALVYLLLASNQIKELLPGVVSNLTHLENIEIKNNAVPLKLHKHSFANLPSLKSLFIKDSAANLPEDLLTGCSALKTIDFSGNKIASLPVNIFKDLQNLESLDLSYNQIAALSSTVFSPMKKLNSLNLNRNHLEVLPESLFSGLRKLTSVSMDDNFLTTISQTTFQGAVGLQTVSMRNNRLTFEKDVQYADYEVYSPFNVLIGLKNLYLSGNQIRSIFYDWQNVLTRLKLLDLSRNNFTFLISTECKFLSNNLVVDLRHNNISMIKIVTFTYESPPSDDPGYEASTNTVLVDDNPLLCDCGLYQLAMAVRGDKPLSAGTKFDVGNAKCAEPSHLQGQKFSNISIYDFKCELPEEMCSNSCSSCELRPATNILAYDCDTEPANMSDPKEFGYEYLTLTLKTAPSSLDNLNLQLLNISNIGLEDIPFSPSKSVKAIDFSNNKLTKIPMEFITSNVTLYLANNQFVCDCWHSKELSILKNRLTVEDRNLIKCGDKLLSNMDPMELCNNWRAAAVASGTFIVLILIVAIIATFVYKNLHEIQVFIIKHSLCPGCFIENIDDIDKEYDVFVSYAHKDRQYLEKLMPKLEKEFGLKTCVHYRDWFVGDFIPDQINRSVENSRKTIILLSNNFLDSAYANMEFRAAHNLALKEGRNRIILILLEDVAHHEKLSDELKAHMKMNTYLKWEDSGFNDKLQKAMPLINNKKFVWPGVFKQATEKTVKGGLDVHVNSEGQLFNACMKDAV